MWQAGPHFEARYEDDDWWDQNVANIVQPSSAQQLASLSSPPAGLQGWPDLPDLDPLPHGTSDGCNGFGISAFTGGQLEGAPGCLGGADGIHYDQSQYRDPGALGCGYSGGGSGGGRGGSRGGDGDNGGCSGSGNIGGSGSFIKQEPPNIVGGRSHSFNPLGGLLSLAVSDEGAAELHVGSGLGQSGKPLAGAGDLVGALKDHDPPGEPGPAVVYAAASLPPCRSSDTQAASPGSLGWLPTLQ